MTAAKFLVYALADDLETKSASQIISTFERNGWQIHNLTYKSNPYDNKIPYFDNGQKFSIAFPGALASHLEVLTRAGEIVQTSARLDFKQALFFSKASKHVMRMKTSLDWYYGAARWKRPNNIMYAATYENAVTFAYMTRTISEGHDTLVLTVGRKKYWI